MHDAVTGPDYAVLDAVDLGVFIVGLQAPSRYVY
jgi:hypothetical protein